MDALGDDPSYDAKEQPEGEPGGDRDREEGDLLGEAKEGAAAGLPGVGDLTGELGRLRRHVLALFAKGQVDRRQGDAVGEEVEPALGAFDLFADGAQLGF